MNPLFLSVALSTLAADTGSITFRGAVVAPTCSYHHVEGPHVVDAGDCYQGTRPMVTEPATQPDPATMELLGTNIPTWRLTYL
ncbi:hypothetical protein [Pinirhizobacter soli]|uniref:hypothetical protein n=1 Tax=Pinirhizobacter soli TaxID=2786953 RepID=UPI00202A8A88|nr:hypothetical protein [Pinirhizobacter soli]